MKWRLDDGQIEVVDERVAEILRRKTPAERFQMGMDANKFARLCIAAGLRAAHPDWSETQVQAEVARRMLLGSE